jgi:hypothetical protein
LSWKAISSTPRNVQLVVVSDLEFVGLKRHPAYTHRPGVREVQEVAPELTGTLERGNENIVVTSESAARARLQRYREIHARAKELLDAQEANTAKAEAPVKAGLSPELDGSLYREDENLVVVSQSKAEAQKRRLAEARERLEARHNTRQAGATNDESVAGEASLPGEPVHAAPTDSVPDSSPLSQKPASWWRPLIFGGAVIPKAEATLAVRMILSELRITVDERALDFGTDNVVKSTFSKVLEQLSGSDLGWRTMVQIYERQQARERIWADH